MLSTGEVKYKLSGRYSESIEVLDVISGESWNIWEAPPPLINRNLMFNFNDFALQLNLMSDRLQALLPPTDSRLRPDLRDWENGKSKEATLEKNRLENNQRIRRRILKSRLGNSIDFNQEQTFYNPKFFIKEYDAEAKRYNYRPQGNLYWELREKQDWSSCPKIFEDNCPPFYE